MGTVYGIGFTPKAKAKENNAISNAVVNKLGLTGLSPETLKMLQARNERNLYTNGATKSTVAGFINFGNNKLATSPIQKREVAANLTAPKPAAGKGERLDSAKMFNYDMSDLLNA